MNVEITALADANLEEIYLRIRKDSPGRATEWREGLLKADQTLEHFLGDVLSLQKVVPTGSGSPLPAGVVEQSEA
jgi:hypothetical protein